MTLSFYFRITFILPLFLFFGCAEKKTTDEKIAEQDSVINSIVNSGSAVKIQPEKNSKPVSYDETKSDSIVNFAETLIGIPYKYASTDPAQGFDCSGFITYVFNHFKINVPRSSVDFTNVGTTIHLPDAKRGDLILFTGTDSTERIVGHMGIITENIDTLKFIHATSGKQYGVTITPFGDYYKGRFVKIIRYI